MLIIINIKKEKTVYQTNINDATCCRLTMTQLNP